MAKPSYPLAPPVGRTSSVATEALACDRTPAALEANTRLRGWWLVAGQVLWVILLLLNLAWFSMTLVAAFEHPCAGPLCIVSPAQVEILRHLGIGLGAFTVYFTGIPLALVLAGSLVVALLFWRRSDDWLALIVGLFLLVYPITNFAVSPGFALIPGSQAPQTLGLLLQVPDALIYYGVFLIFPNGRFVPRWTWLLLAAWAAYIWTGDVATALGAPFPGWVGLGYPVLYLGALGTQIYRYRRVSSVRQRLQTKWVILGFAVALVANVLFWIVLPSIIPGASRPASLYALFAYPLYELVTVALPVSFFIAIQRYQLFDVDMLINRALVYGALTVCVIGIYVLIVGYLGAALHVGSNPVISLVAAAVVALLFQPLRERLQRGANRLMFGDRDTPYAVLARLDGRLSEALPAETALSTIVATVASALKLPYAAITLAEAGTPDASNGAEDRVTSSPPHEVAERVAVEHGSPAPIALRLPLVYGAEKVGDLYLASRSGETTFATADERLLKDLAAHAGVVAHAVRLTADLRAARERLVTTREEERRRLRRDLHDGLGPQLASLILTLTAAREYLTRDPVAADTLLAELATHVQSAIADVRRLVYELRPPSLDDLGLAGALRDQALRYSRGGLEVLVDAPTALAPLPAAVEVAAYRVCLEALTNVVRHAQAHRCVITLHQEAESSLHVEVSDDGVGVATDATMGVGLRSMRERAEELGGMCLIEPAPGSGTRIRLYLPLPAVEV